MFMRHLPASVASAEKLQDLPASGKRLGLGKTAKDSSRQPGLGVMQEEVKDEEVLLNTSSTKVSALQNLALAENDARIPNHPNIIL